MTHIEMDKFDPDNILAQDMRIEGVDDILYDIGLSVNSCRDEPKKRRLIYHPLFILAILIIHVIQVVISLYLKTTNELAYFALLDFDYFIGLEHRVKINKLISIATILFSQCVYYYNHKRGIEPSFFRIFQMMSGSITPSSVGLVNEKDVKYLLFVTKKLHKILNFSNEKISVIFLTLLTPSIYLLTTSKLEYLIFLPLNTIIITMFGLYYVNIVFYQIFYFFIMFIYLNTKIKNLNKKLIQMKCGKRFININAILASFDALYREINEYNATYWSKFLFNQWLTMGTLCVLILSTIFNTKSIYLKLLFAYFLLILIVIFLFTILTAAAINNETNKTYKIMNSFIVSIRKIKMQSKKRLKVSNYI